MESIEHVDLIVEHILSFLTIPEVNGMVGCNKAWKIRVQNVPAVWGRDDGLTIIRNESDASLRTMYIMTSLLHRRYFDEGRCDPVRFFLKKRQDNEDFQSCSLFTSLLHMIYMRASLLLTNLVLTYSCFGDCMIPLFQRMRGFSLYRYPELHSRPYFYFEVDFTTSRCRGESNLGIGFSFLPCLSGFRNHFTRESQNMVGLSDSSIGFYPESRVIFCRYAPLMVFDEWEDIESDPVLRTAGAGYRYWPANVFFFTYQSKIIFEYPSPFGLSSLHECSTFWPQVSCEEAYLLRVVLPMDKSETRWPVAHNPCPMAIP